MRLISTLIIIFLPLIIFSANFLLLVSSKITYHKIFEISGIYQNFSTKEEANYLIDNLLGYFRGKNMLEQNFFSIQAILHLADVKQIIDTIKIFCLFFSIIIAILVAVLIYKKRFDLLSKNLVKGAIVSIVITILISLLFAVNFSIAFEKLHLIIFRNQFWLFSENDSLFRLFPGTFFMSFALILVSCIIITSLLIMALGKFTIKND